MPDCEVDLSILVKLIIVVSFQMAMLKCRRIASVEANIESRLKSELFSVWT